MAFMNDEERHLAGLIGALTHCNPFLEERIEFEKAILGKEHQTSTAVWSMVGAEPHSDEPNLMAIGYKAEALGKTFRDRLVDGAKATNAELVLYQELALYAIYHAYRPQNILYDCAKVSHEPCAS